MFWGGWQDEEIGAQDFSFLGLRESLFQMCPEICRLLQPLSYQLLSDSPPGQALSPPTGFQSFSSPPPLVPTHVPLASENYGVTCAQAGVEEIVLQSDSKASDPLVQAREPKEGLAELPSL